MKKTALLFAVILSSLIGFGQAVNIGDILCTDGSIVKPEQFASSGKTADGVVFFVDDNSRQGWAVSLECQTVNTHWVTSEHYGDMFDIPGLDNCEYSRDALNDLNGYQNTAIIRAAHGTDWYPAAWAVDFGNGWYLPAGGQLRWLMAYLNEVNASLTIVNGTPFTFDHPRWYWTSSERGQAHAVVVSQTGSIANYPKWNYLGQYEIGVRAVKNFTLQGSCHHIGEVVTTSNGQRGVVYYISPEDASYWLVALNDLPNPYKWGPETDIADLTNYNENDQFVVLHGVHCGYDATLSIKEAVGSSPQYASSHVELENGWHIPSAGQLSKLFAALPFIEPTLANNGGSTLTGDYYWTSTECSSHQAWSINCGANVYTEGILMPQNKQSEHMVRPVWSEPCSVVPPTPEPTLPDNILDSDCNDNTPIPFEGGQLLHQTDDNVNVYSTPLCGDLDGDGIVDIVVPHYTATDENYKHWSNQLGVYSGNDLTLESTISILQEVYLQYCPLALVRYPLDNGDMQGAIFAMCNDGKLRSYAKNGQLLHTSDHDPACEGPIAFADFNNDGYPEVYVGHSVYDAATLTRLCEGPADGNKGLSYRGSPNTVYPHRSNYAISYAYNVLGDDRLELVCGNTIYNVNIVSRTNPALNSITVNKTITPPNGFPQDGHVAIADLDLDGEVDIVVSKDPTDDCTEDYAYLYAYRPSDGEVIFHYSLFCRSFGFPAICNIDNDPHPEILFVDYQYDTYAEKMRCMRYTTGSGLNTLWQIHHDDPSGMTTMAFFDFNRDEIPEIVFRDAYHLNILDGSDGHTLYSYPMRSGTGGEHAIVADVNGDEHAEIIATGLLESVSGNNGYGSLTIFGNENWPLTRQVWNQYAYNVTNVNNDLTVPYPLFDNATVFTAPDGTVRRPYNNFMQQAYYITQYGEPYNPGGIVEVDTVGLGCNSFTFHGVTYNESGLYEQLIESPEGCDTLYTIDITLGETVTYEWEQRACDHYVWNGTNYTNPGDYVQEFVTPQGCDSIVTLHLSFADALEYETDTTVCGSLSWNGQNYTESGVYTQQFVDIDGCDSIVHLGLTVEQYPESVGTIEGLTEVYVTTDLIWGQYYYSIAPVGFANHYEWELEGADWPMSPDGTQCSLLVTLPGTGTLHVKAWNDCGFTEQEIIIHAGYFDINDNQVVTAALYPNPASDMAVIEAEGINHVKVYDLKGQLVKEWAGDTSDRIELNLSDLASALYTVEVLTHRGRAILKLGVVR